ncbi:MAG: Hsp70 family protein [Planctomycetota bacterium]
MNDLTPHTATIDDPAAQPPRYVVGIDLGTTNCALCWIDSHCDPQTVRVFRIPQVCGPGQTERLETLPSFCWFGTDQEITSALLQLPWQTQPPAEAVGVYAREQGRLSAGRLIESAKSWLCHAGVDRRAALLPWHGAPDVPRISPVTASARYLRHLREAWNADHPTDLLEHQDVIVTIPASFDEVARELTVQAAREAGLPRMILLEEPQAAFYAWVHEHRDSWEQQVSPGQRILVCDIGGGTSDFSLIQVRRGEDGRVQFHRAAVGDHLLLGGDNLDLALAHHVEQLLERRITDARQWGQLTASCRHAKETLLGPAAPESLTLHLSTGGSRLIGGSLQVQLTRKSVITQLLTGFLPDVKWGDEPQRKQSGFQEYGLPYAADAAISRYLAGFLRNFAAFTCSASTAPPDPLAARPDLVLFNGGFFESPILRDRMLEVLQQLFAEFDAAWTPAVLRNDRLDLAVAQGAAVFGMVRRGHGTKISAGLARTWYVAVEQADGRRAAVCLAAAGTEAGDQLQTLDREFRVRTWEPVEFPILVSGTRLSDQPGQLVDINPEQLTSLPPIRTVLTGRHRMDAAEVSAQLAVRLTEIGTLELWCRQTDASRRWQLQFDVRAATQTDRTMHSGEAERAGFVDDETVLAATAVLHDIFGPQGHGKPDQTITRLSAAIDMPRTQWPPSLLRAIWNELLQLAEGRRKSPAHESRWLNLTGYCLRPGFGLAADDWRVEETWRAISARPVHGVPACLAEVRTLFRRIAGGLSAGRQNQLASSVLPAIRQRVRQVQTGRGRAAPYASGNHEAAEIWRMLGALELLELPLRRELGDTALELFARPGFEPVRNALIWMLGRVGSRVPSYGPLNLVVPVEVVSVWVEKLLKSADVTDAIVQLTLMQLSRKTGDRFRDIPESLRSRLLQHLRSVDASPGFLQLIAEGGGLADEEAGLVFGESLPAGLRLGS